MIIEIINLPMIDYIPAQLSDGKEWYIYFYAIHPDTNKLKRKKIKINRIKPISLRRRQAKKIIVDINIKLAAGWNPWEANEAPKSFIKLTEVMETWLREKQKESRPDTYRTYKSNDKIFNQWLKANVNKDLYVGGFTPSMAISVTKWLYMEKNIAERTFNGWLVYFNSLFNWMVRNLYIRENPFKTIKRKKPQAKGRVLISNEERNDLRKWCKNNNKQAFYCMVLLAFHGLIRPLEMTWLKPENFDLARGIIYLPGKITKNGNARISTLSQEVINELSELSIDIMDEGDYVFSEQFEPGKVRIDRRVISNYWARVVRKAIGLRMEVQFYSLRDSGIVQMLRDGIAPNEVQKQADHSSLIITNEYIKHAIPEGQSQIQVKSTEF